MSVPYVEITRREEFSASHRLHNEALSDEENAALFGICNNPHGHGHNYALEVTVRGPVPDRTGMVLNLNGLMQLLQERIVARLDHKHLNHDVDFLAGIVTTAENVAVRIWDELAPEIERYEGCRLHRIRLFESRDNFVEYRGPAPAPEGAAAP